MLNSVPREEWANNAVQSRDESSEKILWAKPRALLSYWSALLAADINKCRS